MNKNCLVAGKGKGWLWRNKSRTVDAFAQKSSLRGCACNVAITRGLVSPRPYVQSMFSTFWKASTLCFDVELIVRYPH